MRSRELEPSDGGLTAVPTDDSPGERVGLGRPLHSQLVASRANDTKRVTIRACGPFAGEEGSAWPPATAGCLLTAHAMRAILATIVSRELVRRLEQGVAHARVAAVAGVGRGP
jgi:hypothetical protein